MANLFFISDTHFGHANMLKFTKPNSAELVRPGFIDVDHMNELMIQRWNERVKPQDHVYHLGDVAINKKYLGLVKRLNGHKRLIFGNHDIFEYKMYADVGFEKLMAYRVLDGIIFSHIPIYSDGLERFKINVHGHLHSQIVTIPNFSLDVPDPSYFSVCVEKIDYTPISLEEIKKKIQ